MSEPFPPVHVGQAKDRADDVRALLLALNAKVDQFGDLHPPQRLLSKRRAAEILGISRGATLNRLIKDGSILVVRVGQRVKVPFAEVERFAREGEAPAQPRKARPPRYPPRSDLRPPPLQEMLARARAIPV